MEIAQIREQVNTEVQKWQNLQKQRNLSVTLTPGASSFLTEVVDNIIADPSDNWKTNEFNKESAQEFAISLIPNALNEIVQEWRYRGPSAKKNIKISTWEIWHAMTPILRNWCFIPKDV